MAATAAAAEVSVQPALLKKGAAGKKQKEQLCKSSSENKEARSTDEVKAPPPRVSQKNSSCTSSYNELIAPSKCIFYWY
jgi:hypothetical protein